MILDQSDRDRLTTLEVQQEHVRNDLGDIKTKVEEMHNILMQAKGAKWAVMAIGGVTGALGGMIAKLIPILTKY